MWAILWCEKPQYWHRFFALKVQCLPPFENCFIASSTFVLSSSFNVLFCMCHLTNIIAQANTVSVMVIAMAYSFKPNTNMSSLFCFSSMGHLGINNHFLIFAWRCNNFMQKGIHYWNFTMFAIFIHTTITENIPPENNLFFFHQITPKGCVDSGYKIEKNHFNILWA